jgi:hypothetical protein
MKTVLRLLLLAGLLAVLPALSSRPVYAALSCNSVCWQQYQACLAGCNNELCRDYCREAKIECSCNCGLGIC